MDNMEQRKSSDSMDVSGLLRTWMSGAKNTTGYMLAVAILTVGFSLALGAVWLQILALISVFLLGMGSGWILMIKLAIIGYHKQVETGKVEVNETKG